MAKWVYFGRCRPWPSIPHGPGAHTAQHLGDEPERVVPSWWPWSRGRCEERRGDGGVTNVSRHSSADVKYMYLTSLLAEVVKWRRTDQPSGREWCRAFSSQEVMSSRGCRFGQRRLYQTPRQRRAGRCFGARQLRWLQGSFDRSDMLLLPR